ncbi:MAG: threonine--tRNA ligase [Actinobacteria bacterium]|nr:threonine--tRNA ligase [Actinomycetota bacterium]
MSEPNADIVCWQLSDGTLVDLSVNEPAGAKALTQSDPEGRQVLRHSTAHITAQAVLSIWPDALYAGGPPIENGFYYDFDIGRPFTPEDLEQIEAKMAEIIAEDQPFERQEVGIAEAAAVFKGQPFKLEWIQGIDEDAAEQGVLGGSVSVYRNGNKFVDLCRGPHIPSTGRVRAFKILRSSGAYWKGSEKNQMLQRIYGTAWESQEALDDYTARLAEAERRDHRRIGKELELFTTDPLIGGGLPLWLPNGATIRRQLERFIVDEEIQNGYQHVYSPNLAKKDLYVTSGHWDHYRENMFPPIVLEHEELVLRPMNCPHHIVIYSSRKRSYRELPLRIAELGTMYRYERSGVVSGLSRVRAMTLNDAHIFCRADQVKKEFSDAMRMVESAYAMLGITDYGYRLSLRDPKDTEKYVDNDAMWELGENVLREAMIELGLDFEEAVGEAAFYGPKLDIQLRDVLGHEETVSTVQVDFHLPEQFGLEYTAEDGQSHRPVMIHRGVISTMERMVAYLIELYAGAFPTWLSPSQVLIIPIADRHHEQAERLRDLFHASQVRVEVDDSNETLGNRIRKGQASKVPYMLVVGDKEVEAGTVSVRPRVGEQRHGVAAEEFLDEILREISTRALPSSG